jgi:hypothetical protein
LTQLSLRPLLRAAGRWMFQGGLHRGRFRLLAVGSLNLPAIRVNPKTKFRPVPQWPDRRGFVFMVQCSRFALTLQAIDAQSLHTWIYSNGLSRLDRSRRSRAMQSRAAASIDAARCLFGAAKRRLLRVTHFQITLLVVASRCALVIATPSAVLSANRQRGAGSCFREACIWSGWPKWTRSCSTRQVRLPWGNQPSLLSVPSGLLSGHGHQTYSWFPRPRW